MLEAKIKNQGHKRKCSPKKKSSKKFFRRSQKKTRKGLQKIVSDDLQIFNDSKDSAVLELRTGQFSRT